MATAAPTYPHVLPLHHIQTHRQLRSAQHIWIMTVPEREFWQELPLREKEMFREWLIGYKIEYFDEDEGDDDEIEYPQIEDIEIGWNDANPQEKAHLIEVARRHRNPFHEILRIWNLAGYDETNDWDLFRLGFHLFALKPGTAADHHIIGKYNELRVNNPIGLHKFLYRVRTTLADFRAIHPQPSRPWSHRYDVDIPPPTQPDDDFIIGVLGMLDTQFHLTPSDNWFFERTIYQNRTGAGGHRIVHLYARVNDDGILEYRRVVKIQGYSTEAEAWQRTADEFEYHQVLSQSVQADFVLRCYGSSVRVRSVVPDSHVRWLGYGVLEYAPFGSLHDLITAKNNEGANRTYVPEFFIWRVFLGLATALYNMEMGRPWTENDQIQLHELEMTNLQFWTARKDPQWRSMINTDIKTQNVVFGQSLPPYPAIPTPKMIDFGLTYVAPAPNRVIRFHTEPGGTYGWESPEQLRFKFHLPWAATNITVASHIFNVGLIILNLMNGEHILHTNLDMAPHYTQGYTGMYSVRLHNLVMECVDLNATGRPTLAALIYWVKRGAEDFRRDNPFADPWGVEEADLHAGFRLPFQQEQKPPGTFMGDAYRIKRRQAEEGAN